MRINQRYVGKEKAAFSGGPHTSPSFLLSVNSFEISLDSFEV